MKTILDLPRPLLLRIVARAARLRVQVSRYVAESLERVIPAATRPQRAPVPEYEDPLFNELRDELGL